MLIAQITDVHLGFEGDDPDEENARRLAAVIDALSALTPRPDLLIASGDLADKGASSAYARLVAALAPLAIRMLPAIGNHDRRAGFAAAFPDAIAPDGFAHSVWDDGARRIVVLDTLEEGRHGGAFCAARADWLAARLDEARDRPTLIALHHPPIDTGIGWLTTDPAEPWVARLRVVLEGRGNIVALIAGHVHRPISARFAGIPLWVCPSVAPAVTLDLAAIDPDMPDGRAMVAADPPAFALHLWDANGFVTHTRSVTTPRVLARYDAGMQLMVRTLFDERPGAG